MKKTVAALGALLALAVGAGAAHVFDQQHVPTSHAQSRTKAIISQARQTDAPVLLLGDSIVELAYVPKLCGVEVFNAGLAGADVASVAKIADQILPGRKPKLIVIAVGVNDASAGQINMMPDQFGRSYRHLVDQARATGARVVLLNVAPVAASNTIFDTARIAEINRQIASMNMPTIDLHSAMRSKAADALPASFTDDGTHPNAVGYRTWKRELAKACTLST